MDEEYMIDNKCALIIIDMQNDFLPGGSLPVPEGDEIIDGINDLAGYFAQKGSVILSQDWHPPSHKSFASNHPGKKPLDPIDTPGLGPVLWPDHCVQGTNGAEFHEQLDVKPAIAIIRKGYHPGIDSYSVFYENDKITSTGLTGFLNELNISTVFICGLALDYCCYYSAIDASDDGFEVIFLQDLTRGIDDPIGNIDRALNELKKRPSIELASANQIFRV